MQTAYLRHFVDIAEKGSINAAATASFISPQGMSRSLSVLESEFGCQLLKRTPTGMVLTEFGEALLPQAREILRLEQEMGRQIAAMKSHRAVTAGDDVLLYLNNAAFDSALFSPLAGSLQGAFGKVRYFQKDNDEIVEALIAADEQQRDIIALGMLCLFSDDPERNMEMVDYLHAHGFEYYPYLESYDEVLVPAGSPLAAKSSLSKADILSAPIVSSDGDVLHVCESMFGKEAIHMVTADSAFRFQMVQSGQAITFVPAFHHIVAEEDELTRIVPMKNPYYLEIGFAVKSEAFANEAVQRVFARLNDYYQRYASSPYITLAQSELTALGTDAAPVASDAAAVLEGKVAGYGLSSRELDFLPALVSGVPQREIAEKYGLAIATVKSHVYHIYQKLGVHSQQELISLLGDGE